MSSLSIFAGVLLILSSSLIGLWIKRRRDRKAIFYEQYYQYLLFVSEKIGYERMPISEINSSFLSKCKGDFADYLLGNETSLPLSEGETSEVTKYIATIGTTDADTQIASLGGKCAEMKRFIESECGKMRKDGKLYFKLSVLLGIVAFIIVV